jgi:hypothetical protein
MAETEEVFASLRRQLAAQRLARLHVVTADELDRALVALQRHRANAERGTAPYDVKALRSAIEGALQETAPSAEYRLCLDQVDEDTIELIGRLFVALRAARPADSAVCQLLARMQFPVLRLALRDKGFFSDRNHPARQWLDTAVQTIETWIDENEGEADPEIGPALDSCMALLAADHADASAFAEATRQLAQHVELARRRSEALERRRVEAARGRETLAAARARVREAITARLAAAQADRLSRALLEGAWTDALMLSLLRHGETSRTYTRRLEIVDELLNHLANPARAASPVPLALREDLKAGLREVGLHEDDVLAVQQRLFGHGADEAERSISLTELLIRLRQRGHAGSLAHDEVEASAEPAETTPLDPAARTALDHILSLPPGAWFVFRGEDGRRIRRKLAWYAVESGHCLFVNARGTPVAGPSLTALARALADGEAQLLDPTDSPLDRAWSRLVDTLRQEAS